MYLNRHNVNIIAKPCGHTSLARIVLKCMATVKGWLHWWENTHEWTSWTERLMEESSEVSTLPFSQGATSLPCPLQPSPTQEKPEYKSWICLPSLKQAREYNYIPQSRGLHLEGGRGQGGYESQLDMQGSRVWLIEHPHDGAYLSCSGRKSVPDCPSPAWTSPLSQSSLQRRQPSHSTRHLSGPCH